MKSKFLVLFLFPVLLVAQNQAFKLVKKLQISTKFENQNEFCKWYYDSITYEKARTSKKFECLKLNYTSDTAKVEAWLYKPIDTESVKFPLVIYNRGGMGNFGNLEETNMVDFYKIAEAGYVVLATKTRFAGRNGKFDQHGGIDVDDIVNLQKIYKDLNFIDTNNVFMYGFSRGGQNCHQASIRMKLNAMAISAGTTDWISRTADRP